MTTVLPDVGNVPVRQDIDVYRGADFVLPFAVEDSSGVAIDITDYTITASIKRTWLGASVASFDVVKDAPLLGYGYIQLTAENSALLLCGESPGDVASKYVWDLRLMASDGSVSYLRRGVMRVWPQAS